jgi:hypothetical protein
MSSIPNYLITLPFFSNAGRSAATSNPGVEALVIYPNLVAFNLVIHMLILFRPVIHGTGFFLSLLEMTFPL